MKALVRHGWVFVSAEDAEKQVAETLAIDREKAALIVNALERLEDGLSEWVRFSDLAVRLDLWAVIRGRSIKIEFRTLLQACEDATAHLSESGREPAMRQHARDVLRAIEEGRRC